MISSHLVRMVRTRKTLAFVLTLALGPLAAPHPADAEKPSEVRHIGLLGNSSPEEAETAQLLEAFVQALRELGWVEGQNITIEERWAEGKLDRLPNLAAELVRLNVDVLVAAGIPAPLALKRATSTIPIVLLAAGDPVESGLVASLVRPGGNITGLSILAPELGGKRLQLLKEVIPRVSRVAILWNAANPYSVLVFRETEVAARKLGVTLRSLEVREGDDFEEAFEAAVRWRADALITVEDPLTFVHRAQIVDFATKNRLPAMHGMTEFVDVGGLMAYGVNLSHLFGRAAAYVDKILKGANPADLPVEQPRKFDLAINLNAAKTLGLTIPESVLLLADWVIE